MMNRSSSIIENTGRDHINNNGKNLKTHASSRAMNNTNEILAENFEKQKGAVLNKCLLMGRPSSSMYNPQKRAVFNKTSQDMYSKIRVKNGSSQVKVANRGHSTQKMHM